MLYNHFELYIFGVLREIKIKEEEKGKK